MTELLLVIVIVQLGFVLSRLPRKTIPRKRAYPIASSASRRGTPCSSPPSFASCTVARVRSLSGRQGAIFADESPSTQGRGIILDSDDEWVLIECPAPFGAKGATQRLFRIADIKSVAEIVG